MLGQPPIKPEPAKGSSDTYDFRLVDVFSVYINNYHSGIA